MSTLYPRLLPGETALLFDTIQGLRPTDLTALSANTSGRTVFAATGGTRVTTSGLSHLRERLMDAATDAGYPATARAAARNQFDRAAGGILHSDSGMTPGEASQRQVWAFLALVLAPDVCAWRFPMDLQGKYQADRFKGTDLTRHTLARLWTRAHVLYDASREDDPYHLLGVLGESDLDQIMARRRSVAATPALARAVVRASADGEVFGGLPARPVLRDALKRLLRLTAFVDVDGMLTSEVADLVMAVLDEATSHIRRSGEYTSSTS